MPGPPPPIGHLIREWRQRRRLSQSDLAREAEISAKFMSFLETGRALPSRDMVLHLAERLAVPLRHRNIMLDAGGFTPGYQERSLEDPDFRQARQSIDLILSMHEPNPAVAIDRHWTMTAENQAAKRLISGADPLLLTPPVNLVRLCLHPAGLAPGIVNLAEWRRHLMMRLRQQIEQTGDPVLTSLLEEIGCYPRPSGRSGRGGPRDFEAVAVPLRLASVHGPLSFLSATTVFGGPVDITLEELSIESYFPADTATASVMRRMAAEHAEAATPEKRRLAPRAASG